MKGKVILSGVIGMVILSFLLASCAKPAAPAKPQFSAAQIVISPNSGPPTTKIAVTGSGFAPKEEVQLTMTVLGVDAAIGTEKGKIMSNADGAFVVNAAMIEGGPGGIETNTVYTIRAQGMTSGAKATYPFIVIPKKK